jgi:hypothetical protein
MYFKQDFDFGSENCGLVWFVSFRFSIRNVANLKKRSQMVVNNVSNFLGFESVARILTLEGAEILKGHLEKWRDATARTKPSYSTKNFHRKLRTYEIEVIQHIQSFVDSAGRPVPNIDKTNGVLSSRETASFKFGDGNLTLNLTERRYSLMLKMFLGGSPYGQYSLISLVDGFVDERYLN